MSVEETSTSDVSRNRTRISREIRSLEKRFAGKRRRFAHGFGRVIAKKDFFLQVSRPLFQRDLTRLHPFF